ncbi:MAG: ribonuclease HII [Candidatus Zambryskibacteria bacterium]|nr:ribonuclease HII [Candidatus Zambryskibacteria bacterium]
MTQLVGIDEAGRGPLAGPVAVGGVVLYNPSTSFDKAQDKSLRANTFFKGIRDSKQLTHEERELWFGLVQEARRKGELDFAVSLVSQAVIDRHGISYAIRLGIKRVLKSLAVSEKGSQIFLDGSLKAPVEFKHQLTVIKGDEKIPVISLASICAKVVRDRRMVKFSKKYPLYDFDLHKGYGTLIHRQAIKKYGLTELHRLSFLKNLTKAQEV